MNKDFGEIAGNIASLSREQLKQRIKTFHGPFPLDFTEDYLDAVSIDRLRHVLLAAMIVAKASGGKATEEQKAGHCVYRLKKAAHGYRPGNQELDEKIRDDLGELEKALKDNQIPKDYRTAYQEEYNVLLSVLRENGFKYQSIQQQ